VKIVIIEDEQWLAEAYAEQLSKEGFSVLISPTAQEGIDLLDNQDYVDLIILDLFLPQHNGLSVLHHLQSYSDWQQIPVIILTSANKFDIKLTDEEWLDYGVKYFAEKDKITPKQLVAKVKELSSSAAHAN
jgi:DNA-binding response OmpR family regulator